MDRPIVFPGELLADTTLLNGWKSALVGLGYLAEAAIGSSTAVSGLACAPTSPASLQVTVAEGSIITKGQIDASPYAALGTDSRLVVQQGIVAAPTTLTITPPSTAGYSQYFLVQAILNLADGDATLLSYFNSADPNQPFAGPNGGDGTQNYTTRRVSCTIALKAGVSAATGTEGIPAPDAGYVGLYAIHVTNGQTQITSANIAKYSGAPFIRWNLEGMPLAVQQQPDNYAIDVSGSANSVVISLPPATALVGGMPLRIRKSGLANTSAVTATINTTTVPVTWSDGSPLGYGDWPAYAIGVGVYDGSTLRLNGPLGPGIFRRVADAPIGPYYGIDVGTADNLAISSLNPSISGYADGQVYLVKVAHDNLGTSPHINIGGLGALPITRADGTTCKPHDLQAGSDTWLANIGGNSVQIVGLYTAFLPSSRAQAFLNSTTFTVPAGVYKLRRVRVWGAGGGGGGADGVNQSSSGGGGGGYTEAFAVDVNPGDVITVTIGAGGQGGNGTNYGGDGGTTSFGTSPQVMATGGGGGSYNSVSVQGAGGQGSTWQITANGHYGNVPSFVNGVAVGGQGGQAPFSSGVYPLQAATAGGLDGGNGAFPGGGANGACTGSSSSTHTGGNGADGLVIIEY